MVSSMEEWRSVPEWEYYEVSSLGRVRSLDKVVPTKGGAVQTKRGRLLRPAEHRGYYAVRLRDGGRERTVKVHTLVLLAFVGGRGGGMEARHLNGDAHDNRVENLRWGTSSENNLDRVAHGTHQHAIKVACPEGHPYDYVDPKTGGRMCTKCRRKNFLEFKKREKAKADG